MRRRHELKCWPGPFKGIVSGKKRFELRKDDRNYKEGDVLDLREYSPTAEMYLPGTCSVRVLYVMTGGNFGLDPAYVCMSIELMSVNGKPVKGAPRT